MKKLLLLSLVILCIASISFSQSSWVNQPYPNSPQSLGAVKFVSSTEGWVSCGNGKLLHTTNSGTNWTVVSYETTDTLFNWSDPSKNLCFINASTGWIISTKGNISQWNGAVVYKTTNGGVNWTKLTIPNYNAGIYLQFVDSNNGWILLFNSGYTNGGLFRTTNGGTNWTQVYTPVGGIPYFYNSLTGWLMPNGGSGGTTSDSIRKTTNGGLNWIAPWGTNAQVTLNSLYFTDENNGWAVGKRCVFMKTTNGGNSWSYITNTGLNDSAYSKCLFFLNANTGWIGTSYQVPLPEQSPRRVIMYTNNGGSTWSQQVPSILSWQNAVFSIYFTDSQNGWFASDYGILGHTTNGGVSVKQISTELPEKYSLSQNYPNPFNPSTNIKYQISKNNLVSLKIFDELGREIELLVNEKQTAGTYEVTWDASKYPSGVYFYKLVAGDFSQVKKMILIK